MRVALAVLCVGAVTFLLRVLWALVKEWMRLTPRTEKLYFARFRPSMQRRGLIVMTPEFLRRNDLRGDDRPRDDLPGDDPSRDGDRIAS